MKIGSRFFKDIRRLDKSAFNLTVGLRAVPFVIVPIIVGFATQQPALLFASLGTVFLTFTERFIPTMPSRMLLLVCCTEADSLWSRNSYCYHRPFIVPSLTWNWCICSSFCLVLYKVGCSWYVHGNRFCCWSGFTWLFNTISWSEDILFSYWNVMGSARHRDSSLCYIT